MLTKPLGWSPRNRFLSRMQKSSRCAIDPYEICLQDKYYKFQKITERVAARPNVLELLPDYERFGWKTWKRLVSTGGAPQLAQLSFDRQFLSDPNTLDPSLSSHEPDFEVIVSFPRYRRAKSITCRIMFDLRFYLAFCLWKKHHPY